MYVVFTRINGYAHVVTRTSSYDHANRIARQTGSSVMYADHFDRTYKPASLKRHHSGWVEA